MLVLIGGGMILILGILSYASQNYNLNGFRDRTVGHGQHGTARWATKLEIRKTFRHIPFTPVKWRQQAKKGEQTENRCPRALFWDARERAVPLHWWMQMMCMC